MSSVETVELGHAINAWRVADMPLLEGEGDPDELVSVFVDNGGMLPRRLFDPVRYSVDNPVDLDRHFYRPWFSDAHGGSILEQQLGGEGGRVVVDVVAESRLLAKAVHEASVMYGAAHVAVDDRATRHETVFGFWDNGQQYPTAQSLVERFSKDSAWDLTSGAAQRVGRLDEPATNYNSEERCRRIEWATDGCKWRPSFGCRI